MVDLWGFGGDIVRDLVDIGQYKKREKKEYLKLQRYAIPCGCCIIRQNVVFQRDPKHRSTCADII